MTTCALWFVMWFPWCVPDMSEPPPLAQDLTGNIRVTIDELEPSATDRWLELQAVCKVDYPPHAPGEKGYHTYRTYEVYQLALFQEMCLSWYAMQQPKYHGILLSRGAPNF